MKAVDLEIKTADELVDAALESRWAARRTGRLAEPLRRILGLFLDRGGPLAVDALAGAVPPATLAELDAADLIVLRDGRVEVAYPFATGPNPFGVVFADTRRRYACCAIDALGIPAMVRQPVVIDSRCHHCQAPIRFPADTTGPGRAAAGVLVWVGRWAEPRDKACDAL